MRRSGVLGNFDVSSEVRRGARPIVGELLEQVLRYGWLDGTGRDNIVEVESGAAGGCGVERAGIYKSLRLLARVDTIRDRCKLLGGRGEIIDKGVVVGGVGIHGKSSWKGVAPLRYMPAVWRVWTFVLEVIRTEIKSTGLLLLLAAARDLCSQWASGLLEFLLSQTLLALLVPQSRSSTAIISSLAQLELAIRGICGDEVYPSSWSLRKTILVGISFSSQAFR